MIQMFQIFWEMLSPIFIIILLGYGLQKKFRLDLVSLTKIQLYLFLPSLIFINIVTSELNSDMIIMISCFTIVLFFVLMLLSYIVAKLLRLDRKREKAFINAITLRNQGNYGIPLITLLYSGVAGNFPVDVHMIVYFISNLLLNIFGLYNASSGSYTKKEAFFKILRLPAIHVIVLGFVFKGIQLPIPTPIFSTLSILKGAVVPLALFTLGAQLASIKLSFNSKSLPIATAMRLILSPIIAFAMVKLMGITGIVAEVLIIGASAPTALNSVLFAIEFNGDSEYASESVLITTLLSVITVTFTIMLVR